ncbi:hypothetical protein BB561_001216 [Smittium simulii]|uniref:Protein PNS1 n=1 Tax=Smittium simulii TaxID=133385 RepID=A0A2T9YVL1_9FUNG|nr:hypothetical protein BB561_001216 [Smittium simulii]
MSAFFVVLNLPLILEKYNTNKKAKNNGNSNNIANFNYMNILGIIYIVLFYFWTAQIIINVLSTTLSGLVASYYYYENFSEGYPTKFPLLSSLKRAVIFSFGSICYGSLIVEFLQLVRSILIWIKSDNNTNVFLTTLTLFSETILFFAGEVLESFNKYAYINIAIYGKPFSIAAIDTWSLLKKKQILIIINDSLVNSTISVAAFGTGILCAAISFTISIISSDFVSINFLKILSTLAMGLVFGSYTFNNFTKIFDSGVATTFVCLASDPDIIKKSEPELYEYMREKYPEILT